VQKSKCCGILGKAPSPTCTLACALCTEDLFKRDAFLCLVENVSSIIIKFSLDFIFLISFCCGPYNHINRIDDVLRIIRYIMILKNYPVHIEFGCAIVVQNHNCADYVKPGA
jgi:hypothetical protein